MSAINAVGISSGEGNHSPLIINTLICAFVRYIENAFKNPATTGSDINTANLPNCNAPKVNSNMDANNTAALIYCTPYCCTIRAIGMATTPAAPAITPGPRASATNKPTTKVDHIPDKGFKPITLAYATDGGIVLNETTKPDNTSCKGLNTGNLAFSVSFFC